MIIECDTEEEITAAKLANPIHHEWRDIGVTRIYTGADKEAISPTPDPKVVALEQIKAIEEKEMLPRCVRLGLLSVLPPSSYEHIFIKEVEGKIAALRMDLCPLYSDVVTVR